MLDKKGRIFGKVSLIDIFAVVMLAAVFFVVYFTIGGRNVPTPEEARYVQLTFFAPAVDDFTALSLAENTRVMDDDGAIFMGMVTDVTVGDSIFYESDRYGNTVRLHYAGFNSVYVSARIRAPVTEGAVVLGNRVYAIGDEVLAWVGNVRLIVHISHIWEG
ncbi:MAG: DUF4330 domain-containing protein [Defluviitaleaceae bacterium]|nr:DUF4330 domain-containing protein [Defluviitaleaceae bacterium]MCL2273512.1 DUF4330 domain-containing protein [Defluviitaleaceae bacterium]